MKKQNWISIFLWSFGIVFVPLFLMWLRVNDLKFSGADIKEIIYYLSYVSAFIFGFITAILTSRNKNDQGFRSNVFQQPFLPLWLAVVIFSVMPSFWFARSNHFVQGRSFIADIFSNAIMLFLTAIVQIIIPFFAGYSLIKFVRCAIVFTRCKE